MKQRMIGIPHLKSKIVINYFYTQIHTFIIIFTTAEGCCAKV